MSTASIQIAFEKALVAMPMQIATAYENLAYKPIKGTPYQTANLVPSIPENPTFGDGYYRENGVYRLRLFFPKEVGTKDARIHAERLRDYFPRGMTLQQDGLDIIIQRTPYISPGLILDDRYSLVVDIRYFASVFGS